MTSRAADGGQEVISALRSDFKMSQFCSVCALRLPRSFWMRCAIWQLSLWYRWTHPSTSRSWSFWVKAHTAKSCWLFTKGEVRGDTNDWDLTHLSKRPTSVCFFVLAFIRNSDGSEVLPSRVHLALLFPEGVQPLPVVLHPPVPDQSAGNCLLHTFTLCLRSASQPLWRSLRCHHAWGRP